MAVILSVSKPMVGLAVTGLVSVILERLSVLLRIVMV